MVLLYGDKLLERGIAVLAVDGPGQAECVARGIRCTADSHAAAGIAICDWLARHPAIDASRIALRAISFGTYFGLVAAAALGDRLRGAAVSYVVHEPGMRTIFGHAAPTFKVRFMMMAGYEDEDAFDRFMAEWDVKRWGRQLRCPVLIQGGEEDELSPIAYSEELLDVIAAPKQLAIYEGHKHGLRGGGAVAAGEHPDQMYADWLADRLAGRPMKSEKIFVRMDGSMDRIAL
jgi:pimeloyl-ACP methyl ester carboxylesterase